jgi:hypothetical protein
MHLVWMCKYVKIVIHALPCDIVLICGNTADVVKGNPHDVGKVGNNSQIFNDSLL